VRKNCQSAARAHSDGCVTRFEQPEDAGQLGDCDDDGTRLNLGALAAGAGEDFDLPF
jgi:hypothetical protein